MLLFRKSYGLILSLCFSYSLYAAPQNYEVIKLPECLAKEFKKPFRTLAQNDDFKIIELDTSLVDDLAHLADKKACGRFINISHHFAKETNIKSRALKLLVDVKKAPARPTLAYNLKHPKSVNALLNKISTDNMLTTLSKLTSYHNRSASSHSGLQSIEWMRAQFESIVLASGRDDINSYFVKTGEVYLQPSLVTVIGKNIDAPAIVLGAHIDTLEGNMPGASDDGSGAALLLETARLLLDSKLKFKRPIYIIWYAAEERGLVGSQYVVRDFLMKKIPVEAVIQFDMAAYRHEEEDKTIWIFKDYTDKALNQFVASLIKTYVKVPIGYSKCGYACSDHASWMSENIPASLPFETSFDNLNPYIHSPNDKMSTINSEHLANFTKIALAFAVELGLS
ncbi:MAG: M20/M25/M40 family metallo-hydrolase [Proteobacteria bacterium]|nr:M20/M25/M40 family metallo-hydrolase [Pseudomonadota bacterium]